MEKTTILNYSDLLARLTELKSERETQEISLKYTFTEFVSSINLVSFFKSKSNNLLPNDLMKSGLSMAVNMIAGLVLGKNRSVKGFLSTLMVERLTTMVIDNNLIELVSKITSLFFNKKESE